VRSGNTNADDNADNIADNIADNSALNVDCLSWHDRLFDYTHLIGTPL